MTTHTNHASTIKLVSAIALIIFALLPNVCRSMPAPASKLIDTASSLLDVATSDIASPEFARPDEGDLQKNSARLHRTLFLLNTSNLLKKARIFSENLSKMGAGSKPSPASSLLQRQRRSPSSVPEEAVKSVKKHFYRIKVRKPTLTVVEEDRAQENVSV